MRKLFRVSTADMLFAFCLGFLAVALYRWWRNRPASPPRGRPTVPVMPPPRRRDSSALPINSIG